ncbi:putative MerR family transcriptional regulator [Gordonia effusa NBRC 100432]|uniref:Putative MerR family transcriptional regulator n=1 Tax=Gordonia effusa NBRC 100432 TaxID=1077974 RepID=H0R6T9_9ACTN|nr:MerR family transcriptional regulator [Gordonia effusa]GAB20790.1 putative MerR family transcriptional regulator [Gordonia effusa NBRC 100432]
MRIGELAGLAGVSPRTVRHYHQLRVLPEPRRDGNGYRHYDLTDLIRLLRVRGLTDLGMSLDEVAHTVADDSHADLIEILTEIDSSLAAQQDAIQAKRDRIAAVVDADGEMRSEALLAILTTLTDTLGPEHPQFDREAAIAELLDHTVSANSATEISQMYSRIAADDLLRQQILNLTAEFEKLADEPESSPRVEEIVKAFTRFQPALLALTPPELVDDSGDSITASAILRAASTGLSAAQRRCLTLLTDNIRNQS